MRQNHDMTLHDPTFSFGLTAVAPKWRFAAAIAVWGVAVWLLGGWAALAVFGVVAMPVVALAGRYPHPRIGLCNFLTVGRLAFASALAVQETDWFAVGLALAALATDGFDGWAARRARLQSDFGARLDMEVDSFLALVLAFLAVGKMGEWVLLLGLLRYIWIVAGVVVPRLNGPLPPRFSRKAVCVIQIASLIVILSPVVTPDVATIVTVFAGAALLWSFGLDAVWRLRHG